MKTSRRTSQERVAARLVRSQTEMKLREDLAAKWSRKATPGRRPAGYSWAIATAQEVLEDLAHFAGRGTKK